MRETPFVPSRVTQKKKFDARVGFLLHHYKLLVMASDLQPTKAFASFLSGQFVAVETVLREKVKCAPIGYKILWTFYCGSCCVAIS